MPHYKLAEKRKFIKANHLTMTVQEMALELNVTDDNVRYHLGVMDLEKKSGKWLRNPDFTDEQKAFIAESAGVLTCQKMMKVLDCGYDRIVNYYRANGLEFGKCKGALKQADKEYIEANIDLGTPKLLDHIQKTNTSATYQNVHNYVKKIKDEKGHNHEILNIKHFSKIDPAFGKPYKYPSHVQFLQA